MGEDTSKPKIEQSDSEIFDIAVRRDDTKSLEEVTTNSESSSSDDTSSAPETSFDEIETTVPENDASSTLDENETAKGRDERPVASIAPAVTPVATPDTTRVVPPVATTAPVPHNNSAGVLVLQWLSYAFWGWFGTSLAVLAGITFGYFIAGSDATFWGDSLAYPLAAVIVMLVIALVTDFFYARHEPLVKKGAASVIMLIHVVVYLLTVVGALIGIVFSIISMLITANPIDTMDGTKVFMLTAAVIAVVFGAISLRALMAGKRRGVRKGFWLLMSVLALGFVIASIVGPAMKANSTKDDRLVEQALPSLVYDIREYASKNDKLPTTLGDVKSVSGRSDGSVQLMLDKNLVTYKPNTKSPKIEPSPVSTTGSSSSITAPDDTHSGDLGSKTFYYQLCVTYKEVKDTKYSTYEPSSSSDSYTSYISTSDHDKGNVCYDVSVEGKSPYYTY